MWNSAVPRKPLFVGNPHVYWVWGGDGAAGGDRTHDPWLRRPILYPLSYSRNAELILVVRQTTGGCLALADASQHQRWILTVAAQAARRSANQAELPAIIIGCRA